MFVIFKDEPVSNVLPELKSAGIRVYTLSIGSTIDASLLHAIAPETGGHFFRTLSEIG